MRLLGLLLLTPAVLLCARSSSLQAADDLPVGVVAWFDITTTNLDKSKAFYHELFGWELVPVPGTNQALNIRKGAEDVGTLRVVAGGIGANNGIVYFNVDDISAAFEKAKSLGGKPGGQGAGPFDLPNGKGSLALIIDPVGHLFGLWSKNPTRK